MRPGVDFVREDGKTFSIGKDSPFALTEIDGIGAPVIEVTTEKPAQGDGAIVTGSRVDARVINLTAKNRLVKYNAQMRATAARFFVPGYRFTIRVTWEGTERSAECVLKALKIPTENPWKPLELTMTLLCENGWLSGGGLNGANINSVAGGFGFPYVSLLTGGAVRGFVWGVYNFDKVVELNNDGEAESWIRAVMTASGEVTNPSLIHGDAFVRVVTTLEDGDVLEIDTEKKTVTLNGVNALNLVDKDSWFGGMKMGLGMNTIGFDADAGDNLLDVTVYYYKRYGGV